MPRPRGRTTTIRSFALRPKGVAREPRPEHRDDADERCGDAEVRQRPRDRRVVADIADPLTELAEHPADGLARFRDRIRHGARHRAERAGPRAPDRRVGRQRQAEDRGEPEQDRHEDDQRLRSAADRHDQRCEQRIPERERAVEREREDPVRGDELLPRNEHGDHRRLGGCEEDSDDGEERVQEQEQPDIVAGREDPDQDGRAQRVGHDENRPAVDPVDIHARERGQEDRRHEERQEEAAHRGGQVGRLEDDDGQGVEHHVDADLRRELRQPEQQEGPIAQDRGRRAAVLLGAPVARRRVGHASSAGRGATAALIAASPRVTNPARRLSSARRSSSTCRPQPWQRRPMSAPRRSTSHSRAAAGMGAPEPDDVAQEQLERWPGGHRRDCIRGVVRHRWARDRARSPARVIVSTGVTLRRAPG